MAEMHSGKAGLCWSQGMNLQQVMLRQVVAFSVGVLNTCCTLCVLLNFDSELAQKHAVLRSRSDRGELMQKDKVLWTDTLITCSVTLLMLGV